jgi:hypothetical protein
MPRWENLQGKSTFSMLLVLYDVDAATVLLLLASYNVVYDYNKIASSPQGGGGLSTEEMPIHRVSKRALQLRKSI